MGISARNVEAAVKHLRASDPVMRQLIRRAGPFELKLQRDRFRMLVRSIIAQQISTSAARSIGARVDGLVAPATPTAANLADLSLEVLRSAGLSPQKAGYMHDLCARAADGRLELKNVGRLSDEKVIEHLTQVKGIGRWTAQMFLIFSLGRLDVFPHDDLGVRVAIRNLYGLSDLPDKSTSHEIAAAWKPYSTVASWYCWRSLELKPKK